jgi:hypothetical protein
VVYLLLKEIVFLAECPRKIVPKSYSYARGGVTFLRSRREKLAADYADYAD